MPVPAQEEYIQVIVPLKLDWNPTYRIPAGLRGRIRVGDRVKVRVSGRLTDAVVCATACQPDIDPSRIHPIEGLEEGLERITAEEIRFWNFLADYYLCTVGEVFKCAYPGGKIRSEEIAARAKERAEASQQKIREAACLRITRLEAEIRSVNERTEQALARLTERGVKTRAKLIANREARLERLQEALVSARALAGAALPDGDFAGVAESAFPTESGRPAEDNEAPSDSPFIPCSPEPELQKVLDETRPVLLQGSTAQRHACYRDLISDTLAQGRSALLLVPEIALTESFEADMRGRYGTRALVFHSKETTARRRKIADALRTQGPLLLIGTRSALFLPFHRLGLVIVDEEQDRSYKQDSPAPRYNARDSAVVLAGLHGAAVLLGSGAPSLESLYNASIRRYAAFTLDAPDTAALPGSERLRIIDTVGERRKRGMKGAFSIKLLDEIRYTLDQGCPVYLIRLWGDTAQTVEQTRALFPETDVAPLDPAADDTATTGARIRIGTLAQTKRLTFAEGSLAAILQADPLLGSQNFRADERAFQLFDRYREHCAAGTFLIQTGRSEHPAFQDLAAGRQPWPGLMQERKDFGYPPYSRIIDIDFEDPQPNRLSWMCRQLEERMRKELGAAALPGAPVRIEGPYENGASGLKLRVILAKDRRLPARKQSLKQSVDAFVRERKYNGFIHLDVDPE